MYVTEAMITSLEEMMKNASEMEKSIKAMIEAEGRIYNIELDKRRNVRDMWHELVEIISTRSTTSSMMCEVEMYEDEQIDPMQHTHDDGSMHSHVGGETEHHHHEDGTMHNHDGGEMPHTHEDMDALPSDVEPITDAPMPSPADHQADENKN